MKSVLLFLAAFVVAAAVTLAVRIARHDPYLAPAATPSPASPAPTAQPVPPTPPADPHAGHTSAVPTPAAATNAAVVNTRCTLCGMPVDPSIPPVSYKGKLVGFGCRACPPLFSADPDRYGPAALRNEVTEE
jgi:hypothetical protein